MSKTVNGQNYFNEASFNEACEALEHGEEISIYIDVIGHGTNNREQEIYKEALEKKYGDRLSAERFEGGFSYSYSYKLAKK